MLYGSELTAKILMLQKTQTRRPVRDGSQGAAPRCPVMVGESIRLQRYFRTEELTEQERLLINHGGQRPIKTVGAVQVLDARREQLQDISDDDIRREGFATIGDWAIDWVQRFDRRWVAKTNDFEALALARYSERWAERDVWVITFEVTATTMLLAAAPGRSGDYVDTPFDPSGKRIALADEGEVVHPDIVDSWVKNESSLETTHGRLKAKIGLMRRSGLDHRAAQRRILPVDERLRRAVAAAKLSHIDISSERRALHAARERGKSTETIEQRLRAVEKKAYREDIADAA